MAHSLDDGQAQFQCLKCRKYWESGYHLRHEQFVFCPWCGTKFEGELKWEPEWDSPEDTKRGLKFKHRRDIDALHHYDWIVESKFIWENESQDQIDKKPWEDETQPNDHCDEHGDQYGRLPYIERHGKKEYALAIWHSFVDHDTCDRLSGKLASAYRLVLYDDFWNKYGGRKPSVLAICKEYYPTFEKKELDN